MTVCSSQWYLFLLFPCPTYIAGQGLCIALLYEAVSDSYVAQCYFAYSGVRRKWRRDQKEVGLRNLSSQTQAGLLGWAWQRTWTLEAED